MAASKFLTPKMVVARWGGLVTVGTLANWRSKGKGPQYKQMGSRVVYTLADVEAWEEKNLSGNQWGC